MEGGPADTRDTREAILRAAKQRFLHYGYKKTTIDEIAADADVGKGTVYLYFGSKDEIMLTLVLEVKRNITEQMRAIAESLASPEEKLRRMILACVLSVYDACSATAHGNELVDEVHPQLMKHPSFLEKFVGETEGQVALFADVLREGNQKDLFAVPDPGKAAHLFFTAFMAFFPPHINRPCPHLRSRDEIEGGVRDMADFLLAGIRR